MRSFLIVVHCSGGGVFGNAASLALLPISVWPFHCFEGAVHLVFTSFSEEIFLSVATESVCPLEEMSSGSSATILDYPPSYIF